MKKLRNLILFLCFLLTAAALLILSAAAGSTAEPLRYGGSTITDPDVAYVYSRLATELTKDTPPETISIADGKSITVDELQTAYSLFVSDYPECFWAKGNYGYSYNGENIRSISPIYPFTGEALTEAKNDLEAAVEELLGGLPNGDNYEKALYLHDQLAKWVDYEMVGEHQTAYGALVSRKAVCAGYAAAYQLLLNRAGIDAWTVTGVSQKTGEEPVAHAWNLVWIEDGVCVYTDVTWDDGESDIYHAYFNLSKEEISLDHEPDAGFFTLPDCGHDENSYFDQNDHTVTDYTSIKRLVDFFGPAEDGERKAVFYYEGDDINVFLNRLSTNKNMLFNDLACGSGERTYQLSIMANEIHITVIGNFPKMTYLVSIASPDELKTYGEAAQYVLINAAMETMVFRTANGYYFPLDYSVESLNGVQVTRIDFHTLQISGTPTQNTTITLPAPMLMQKEETPQAVFTPGSELGCGSLSGISAGMKYSTDGMHWTEIASNQELPLTGLMGSRLYVVRSGNGETTLDSDRQTLTVPNPLPSEENETDDQNALTGTGDNTGGPRDDGQESLLSRFGIDLNNQVLTAALIIIAVAIIATAVILIRKKD